MSLLALTSLLTALLAPVLSCLCIPTLVFATISVSSGVLSIYKINRSQGQLTGMPLAIIGLLISFPLLIVSIAMAPSFLSGVRQGIDKAKVAADSNAASALSKAERAIVSDSKGIAHGNSPEAKALAEKYAETMKRLREELFTPEDKNRISLTDGNFITWCQLQPDKCAFVVHVPAYRKFDDDAKEALADLAWQSAQATVAGTLEEGNALGVGLKGTLLYGSVMVGTVVASDRAEDGLDEQGTEKEALYPFFEESPAETAIEPVIEMPGDGKKTAPQATPSETTDSGSEAKP
jgi:hypothetical protein